jgi:Putative metallopeptidase
MNGRFSTAAAILSLILPVLPAGPTMAQPSPVPANPKIEIEYVRPTDGKYRPIYDRLRNRRALEGLREFLGAVRFPRTLTVKIDECNGQLRKPYKSPGPVTLCYELIDRIDSVASKVDLDNRSMVIAGTFVQALLHEVAFGIFDLLDVPVWGRPADAADRLAAIVMLKFGEEAALRTVLGSAMFFEASDRAWTGSDFADAVSPDPQRYYNYLCIAYGGAPITFKGLVNGAKPVLPRYRAARCEEEYRQVLKAFDMRIMPYVDPDAVIRIRATPWVFDTDGR